MNSQPASILSPLPIERVSASRATLLTLLNDHFGTEKSRQRGLFLNGWIAAESGEPATVNPHKGADSKVWKWGYSQSKKWRGKHG